VFWKGALTIGVTTAVVECICARLEAFVMGIFDWPITKKKTESISQSQNRYVAISSFSASYLGYKSRT